MAKAKALTGAALTCFAAVGFSTTVVAQNKAVELERSTSAREAATNAAQLKSLLKRRDEIARSPVHAESTGRAESKRRSLVFLDKQIARLKVRVDK